MHYLTYTLQSGGGGVRICHVTFENPLHTTVLENVNIFDHMPSLLYKQNVGHSNFLKNKNLTHEKQHE